MGTQMSVLFRRGSKDLGMTPTTVVVAPLMVSEEPTMEGSAWRRLRQRRSEMTTTGAWPGWSSSAVKGRPLMGATPRTSKYEEVTVSPRTRSGVGPEARLKLRGLETATEEKDLFWARRSLNEPEARPLWTSRHRRLYPGTLA